MSTKTETALAVSGFAGSTLPAVDNGPATAPFVVFLSPKSENLWPRASIAIPGVKEAEPILFPAEPRVPIRLAPFQFFLIRAEKYFGVYNDSGHLVKASPTDPKQAGWTETYETALLVVVGDELIPARCTFKGAKCKAIKLAVDAAHLAGKPDWPKLSAAHAATIDIPDPRFRFTTMVRVTKETVKSGPRAGSSYYLASGSVLPIAAEGRKLLLKFPTGDWAACAGAVNEAFDKRMLDVKEKTVAS